MVYAAVLLARSRTPGRRPAGRRPAWTAGARPPLRDGGLDARRRDQPVRRRPGPLARISRRSLGAGSTVAPTPQDLVRRLHAVRRLPDRLRAARRTASTTYLARGGLGATITPRSKVQPVGLPSGGWQLDVVDPLDRRSPVRALAARGGAGRGVLGTTELLLARATGGARCRLCRHWGGTCAPTPGVHHRAAARGRRGRQHRQRHDQQRLTRTTAPTTQNRFPRRTASCGGTAPIVDDERQARGPGHRRRDAPRPARGHGQHACPRLNRRITAHGHAARRQRDRARARRGPPGRAASRLAPSAAPIATYLPQANAAARAVAAASGGPGVRHAAGPVLGMAPRRTSQGCGDLHRTRAQGDDPQHRVWATSDGDVHEDRRIVLDGSAVKPASGNPADDHGTRRARDVPALEGLTRSRCGRARRAAAGVGLGREVLRARDGACARRCSRTMPPRRRRRTATRARRAAALDRCDGVRAAAGHPVATAIAVSSGASDVVTSSTRPASWAVSASYVGRAASRARAAVPTGRGWVP